MENLQERLSQCQKDIAVLQEQETELKKQIKKQKTPKFGDVVTYSGCSDRRIILYDSEGKLVTFNNHGNKMSNPQFYTPTGQNIFTNNLLNLNI